MTTPSENGKQPSSPYLADLFRELNVVESRGCRRAPCPGRRDDEAIEQAVERQLDGVPFRVMRPEHLAALWLQAGGAKRRERVEILHQAGAIDERHGVRR